MVDPSRMHDGAAFSFSPTGRRWPEGSDEGACATLIVCAAPSSRCRDLLPAGEKGQEARTQAIDGGRGRTVAQPRLTTESHP